MNKILFQTALLTKNEQLAKKLHFYCRTKGIGLYDTPSLAELFINNKCLKPRVVFFDLDSIKVVEFICEEFIASSVNSMVTVCLISNNKNLLDEYKNEKFSKISMEEVEEYMNDNLNQFLQQDFFEVLKNTADSKNQAERIGEILTDCDISSKLLGHYYIKESVLIILANRKNLKSLSKTVFPFVAAKYETSITNVERSIRTAITKFKSSPRFEDFAKANLTKNESLSAKKLITYIVNKFEE